MKLTPILRRKQIATVRIVSKRPKGPAHNTAEFTADQHS